MKFFLILVMTYTYLFSHTVLFHEDLNVKREKLKLAILAKRGTENTIKRWEPLVEYINTHQNLYDLEIIPLDFDALQKSVKNNKVDFVITNTMDYVLLEKKYGVSRIATLVNGQSNSEKTISTFGGVLFTRADNISINSLEDIKGKKIGAVDKLSFGGWIMEYDELINHGIDKNDYDLKFLNTHDNVVYGVLNGKVDVGAVRSDTLESMAQEHLIDLSKIKVLHQQKFDDFPYLVSTQLYPEWPFAKLKKTSDKAATLILSLLIEFSSDENYSENIKSIRWTIPYDYSSVHEILKRHHLPPYDKYQIRLQDIIEQYSWYIFGAALFLVLLLSRQIYMYRLNNQLSTYNAMLDQEVKRTTRELLDANNQIISITDSALDAIVMLDENAKVVFWSKMAEKMFGYTKEEIMNHELLQIIPKPFRELHASGYKAFTKHGKGKVIGKIIEIQALHKSGEIFPVELSITAIQKDSKWHSIGIIRNISERKNMEREHNEQLQKFIDTQSTIVVLTNGQELRFVNKQFLEFFGYHNLDDFKKDYNCICDRFLEDDMFFHLKKVKDDEENWIKSLLNLNGRQRIVSMLNTMSIAHAFTVSINAYSDKEYIVSFNDISDTVREKLQLLSKLMQDPLTKLYNRAFFTDNIQNILQKHIDKNLQSGILFFDIDFFKQVNDTYGHDMGDVVLKNVANVVRKYIREDDIAIRWGGEEFIVITAVKSQSALEHIAEHLRQEIEKSYVKDAPQVTCSFGCQMHTDHQDIMTTLKQADEKLYLAKTSGRNKVVW